MIGLTFETNNYGSAKVIGRSGAKLAVEFIDTGFKTEATPQNIKNGQVKDPTMPTICGVGFMGSGKYKSKSNGVTNYSYKVWSSMIHRCYNKKEHVKRPSYKDCLVCTEWHDYQMFADWFYKNYPGDGQTYHLDKDKSGARVYSPETCEFITPAENSAIAKSKRYTVRSPEGVDFDVSNLTKFCQENGLKQQGMSACACGEQKTHRGWACTHAE